MRDKESEPKPAKETETRQLRHEERQASSSQSGSGELTAGQLVGKRYRIVGLLGRGGMGEVYRADDLELGTSVALKFLPAAVATDPVVLERLRSEVRLARQVAHANVCRVYDIGQADGRWFLTMELITGEDLRTLLRRIGRVPADKAVELARQICAGIAAAHEHGVIHRDLKPANVMIDDQGRARVTDFGLAVTLDELQDQPGAAAGTPMYMAPEQLADGRVTKRSDIYALGLVLYELFTGTRAHQAETIAELARLHAMSTPPRGPSQLVDDIDPVVERVILRCLEPDPQERPPTALAVLAELPGGDPLRAMLEAGETPSPELVAASGRRGTMTPRQALLMGLLIIGGFVPTFWFFGSQPLSSVVGGLLPPQVLEHQAREVLAEIGRLPVADAAWDFDLDHRVVSQLAGLTREERRARLRSDRQPVLRFWYRQSPEPMSPWRTTVPGRYGDVVSPDDPPLLVPGMALVHLGPRGQLEELRVVPGQAYQKIPDSIEAETTISSLLESSGLDAATATPVAPGLLPPMPGSTRRAWTASAADDPSARLRVETASSDSLLTWYKVLPATASAAPSRPPVATSASRSGQSLSVQWCLFLAVGGALAVSNLRTGRWDRRGATRLAGVAFSLCLIGMLIRSHHTLTLVEEMHRTTSITTSAIAFAMLVWLLYVAMEPFIRRYHPGSLISWSRLLTGRSRDPAIGRDLLVGLFISAVQYLALTLWLWARAWHGLWLPIYPLSGGTTLTTGSTVAAILRYPVLAVCISLGYLLVFVLLRSLLRGSSTTAALGLWLLLFSLHHYGSQLELEPIDTTIAAAILATGYTFLAVRCGLLAYVVGTACNLMLWNLVPTINPSDWYFSPTLLVALLLLGLTIHGIRTATAGAPLLAAFRSQR